jgi:23S rRNA (uracil1939-C5)-methyltransferase
VSAITLEITGLGAEGDGIAETANGPIYVPFSHPGDRLKAAVEKWR